MKRSVSRAVLDILGVLLSLHLYSAHAQTSAATTSTASPTTTNTTTTTVKSSQKNASNNWNALTEAQKLALAPLQPVWANIAPIKKQKWLDLSTGYHLLSPEGQATLHFRMKEWASLTTKQRQEARKNFAQTHQLSAAEKQASWQAYQALSPEEKQKLANANKASALLGAAPAVKPTPKDKLLNPTSNSTVSTTNNSAIAPKRAMINPPAPTAAAVTKP